MVKIGKEKDDDMGIAYDPEEPRYPYGTELCFRDDLLESLDLGDAKVGDKIEIKAVAIVVRKSEHMEESNEGSNSDKSIDLQLIQVETAPTKKASKTSILYGDE